MRKSLLILTMIFLVFTACKNEAQQSKKSDNIEQQDSTNQTEELQKNSDGTTVLIGDFIYTNEAAVINGKKFIYGVVLDSMAQELAKRVEPIKKDEYDMVPVVVKGKIKENPAKDGWDEVVEITKIINISKSKSNSNAIEIDSEQKSK